MSTWIECGSCEEMIDVRGGAVRLPFFCERCEAALEIEEEDNIPCDGMPCQGCCFDPPCHAALDSVQAEQYGILDAHNSDVLDQFDEDTEIINDLTLQLAQANLNIQILEETIENLETQLTNLRLDVCDALFGKVI